MKSQVSRLRSIVRNGLKSLVSHQPPQTRPSHLTGTELLLQLIQESSDRTGCFEFPPFTELVEKELQSKEPEAHLTDYSERLVFLVKQYADSNGFFQYRPFEEWVDGSNNALVAQSNLKAAIADINCGANTALQVLMADLAWNSIEVLEQSLSQVTSGVHHLERVSQAFCTQEQPQIFPGVNRLDQSDRILMRRLQERMHHLHYILEVLYQQLPSTPPLLRSRLQRYLFELKAYSAEVAAILQEQFKATQHRFSAKVPSKY
jgi:hypothetical protein